MQIPEFPPATYADWRRGIAEAGVDFEKRLAPLAEEGYRREALYTADHQQFAPEAAIPPGAPQTLRGPIEAPIALCPLEIDAADAMTAAEEAIEAGVNAFELSASPELDARQLIHFIEVLSSKSAIQLLSLAPGHHPHWTLALYRWATNQKTPLRIFFNEDPLLLDAADPIWTECDTVSGLFALSDRAVSMAGASKGQALGLLMALCIEAFRALEAHKHSPNESKFSFTIHFSSDGRLVEEIAQLRAARLLWHRLLSACGADPIELPSVIRPADRVYAQIAPQINILRNTSACTVAALGHSTACVSEPLDPHSTLYRRLARNTPKILQEEAQLSQIADPAGGSYLLETLTCELSLFASDFINKIESLGGFKAAFNSGFIASEIEKTALSRQKQIDQRKRAQVGVGLYAYPQETLEPFAMSSAVKLALWPGLPVHRFAESFEKLRGSMMKHQAQSGMPARIFLAILGSLAEANARLQFVQGVLAAGGFEAVFGIPSESIEIIQESFIQSGCDFAVFCGSDERYDMMACDLAKALKSVGCKKVVLAGRFGESEAEYRQAGIDQSLYLGCNIVALLQDWQKGVQA